MKKPAGLILIVVGLVVLVWGGFGFKTRETIIDLGPIQATRDTTHNLPYAPILGGLILVGGIAILLTGGKTA